MRILHTADWHIGHRLYERNRNDEHRQFLEWLLATIKEREVDVLLVSGDVFDTALPSSEATDLYYQFLFQLYHETDAQGVITAGNHDSPRRLAAPREFLRMGRIHVIGGIELGLDGCIITLESHQADASNGVPAVSIAAIPYLSESEILSHISFETEIEKARRYREAMKQLYHNCVSQMPADVPRLLMGHLVIQGGEESGSERVIQIGGALPMRAGDFPKDANYVALGHLHRSQAIHGVGYPVRYSGSPLPMTFKEAEYEKKVCLLEFGQSRDNRFTEITVPVFKALCRVRGNYDRVMVDAMSGDWAGKYIEVQLTLETPRLGVGDEIREAFEDRGGDVLIVEVQLAEQQREVDLSVEDISAKSPTEIFEEFYRTKYSAESTDESQLSTLIDTFTELTHIASTQIDGEPS